MNKANANGPSNARESFGSGHLSPTTLRRYGTGQLSGSQMHTVERHCLECPLCADALESFSSRPAAPFLGKDLVELNRRLDNRLNRDKRRTLPLVFQPWSMAATLLLLLLSAVFLLTNKRQKEEVAQEENPFTFPLSQDTLIIYQKPAIVLVHSQSTVKSKRAFDASEPVLRNGKSGYLYDHDQTKQDSRVAATEEKSLGPLASAPTLMKVKPESIPAPAGEIDKLRAADLPATGIPALATVTGKVKSAEDGMPLPGVNVVAKGMLAGATTDSDGSFTLSVPQGTDTLVFNFVGMMPAAVGLRNRNNLEVAMQSDVKSLSEVEVIGDSKLKRKGESGNEPEPNPQLDDYLEQNLRYPEPARQLQVKGTVGLEFTVEPDGTLSDFKVTKSLGYGCDEEAVRLLREGPKWKPALENKRPSRKRVKTKIRFGN